MQNIYLNSLDLTNKYTLKEPLLLSKIYDSLTISVVDNKKNLIKETNLDKLFLISFFLFIFQSNPKFEFQFEKEKNFETEVLVPSIYIKNKAKISEISTLLILENKNKIKVIYEKNSTIMLVPLNQFIQKYELSEYLSDHKFESYYLKVKIKHLDNSEISTKNLYPFWICQHN